MTPIQHLANKAYAIALQGGKLSKDEAKYFKNFLYKLDFGQLDLILDMVKRRNEQQKRK